MKKILLSVFTFFVFLPAFAEGGGTEASAYYALAAGLCIAIAVFGGAISQGKIGAKAMEGIARNPQARPDMFVPMIIGLALIESLVIYALIISFALVGKV